jgi:hypothetical protein
MKLYRKSSLAKGWIHDKIGKDNLLPPHPDPLPPVEREPLILSEFFAFLE